MITTEPVEQRWRSRRARWRRPADRPLFDPDCYGIDLIEDDTTAKTYIEIHHYSGSYVSAKYRFGVWQLRPLAGQRDWAGPRLAGVAVLSTPMNKKVLTTVYPGLEPFLNRGPASTHSYRTRRSRPVGLPGDGIVDPLVPVTGAPA